MTSIPKITVAFTLKGWTVGLALAEAGGSLQLRVTASPGTSPAAAITDPGTTGTAVSTHEEK